MHNYKKEGLQLFVKTGLRDPNPCAADTGAEWECIQRAETARGMQTGQRLRHTLEHHGCQAGCLIASFAPSHSPCFSPPLSFLQHSPLLCPLPLQISTIIVIDRIQEHSGWVNASMLT